MWPYPAIPVVGPLKYNPRIQMKAVCDILFAWPQRVCRRLEWLAPLFARIVVGWVFPWSGWGKLHSLPAIVGFMTRISAGALGVTMIVAIISAKWDMVDSFETLLGSDETEYLALFLWLAIAGAGAVSVDRLLTRESN